MNPMSLLVLLALALGGGSTPGEKTPSPALLVLNKGHHDATGPSELAVVDPASGRVTDRVPTGRESHEVAVSPDGKIAVVTNTGPYSDPGHTLSVIDLATRKEIHRVELGPLPNPHGIVWHDGKFYFTAEGARLVGRYDPAKNAVDWMMGIGQNSIHMLVFSKDGKKIYTANRGSASVGVLPLPAPEGPGGGPFGPGPVNVPVGQGPEGIDITPDGSQVWVGCQDSISILDTATDKVVGTIDVPGGRVNRLKFTTDGKLALVAHAGPLVVVDVATHKEVKRIDTGGAGSSILVTPDGSRAYVGMTDQDTVAVIDLAKLEVVSTLKTGDGPDGMAWVAAP